MREKFFAHSANDAGDWQLLDEHLTNVAEKSSEFAKEFDSSDWAYNIGLLHDLGKASDDFQKYLEDSSNKDSDDDGISIKKTNHSSAGAIYAVNQCKQIGKIMAYCIAGHHAGLADWDSESTGNAALSVRLVNDKKYFELVRNYIDNNPIVVKENLPVPKLATPEKDLHLWIRMLYSCLVDADFLDTEKHLNKDKLKRSNFASIEKLAGEFSAYMMNLLKKAETSSVNKIRSEILKYCETASTKKEGFWELSAPTGGGKTLSAIAFAFKHALKFHKKRIIYVIPYTSIIEQTSNILREILDADNVVEHHSSIDVDKESEKMRLACENWDAPVIVTTNVQFFESLYSSKSSRCRKLHNIVNSVVILDEAQMLPPNLLYPCVDALKQLVNNYKATVLFSTATQPALPGIDEIEKIIPDSAELYNKLKRVNYILPSREFAVSSWESVCEKLKKYKQVLCVVNTRRDCYDLYKLMPKGTIHLSALMCPEHRTKKIEEIKQKLKNGEQIYVISTQLIEAGVDIDFPVVYRAFAGIDSIIQTAGRCNREGKIDIGEVFVFVPLKELPNGLMRKGADIAKEMMSENNFQIDSADTSKKYFENLYNKVNSTGKEKFMELLVKNAMEGEFQFATANKEFHLIDDSYSRSIIVKYGESDSLITKLKYGGPNKKLMRKLQRYTVNIPEGVFIKLKSEGLIEEICDGIFIQGYLGYSNETGLTVFGDNIVSLPVI
uniref:CRISPR-associated protein cas3 n=1 Tax=Endomicrobium trichonymphae TaxID=1408204 RepID=A0A1C9ZUC7_ENDTX|nr:CRISPR-associated protein cas3 [Candidatus Endomicrobium trichonymphae]